MTDNRLSPCFEFKLAGADAAGIFQGYASTFGGEPDSYGDVIARGAFAESLKAHQARNSLPALLWAHDSAEPIGRWVTLEEDARGLAVTGRLTLGTKRGAEAHALMKDGALGLSIGYRVPPDGAVRNGSGRTLKRIELFEISAVALPANPSAKVTSVKSMTGLNRPENIREFEAALRDACGFSVREAKRIASVGWPAFVRRDDAEEELREIVVLLTKAAADFTLN